MSSHNEEHGKALLVTRGAPDGIPLEELMSIERARIELRRLATLLDSSGEPTEVAQRAARVAAGARWIADRMAADAGTIATMNRMSVRQIAETAGVRHDTMRRALAQSLTLGEYAEGDGRRRAVTTAGIEQAQTRMREGSLPVARWIDVTELPDGARVAWSNELGALVVQGVARMDADD